MGKFAEAASQRDVSQRGDGLCIAGRWIAENLDEEDVAELTRLIDGGNHKWTMIIRLTDNALRVGSLTRHVHGTCACIGDVAAKGCCTCGSTGRST